MSFSYSRAKLRGALLEGASLLLLRVLAHRQTMPPDLVFPAIDTEGDLCTSSYVSHLSGGPVGSGGVWVRLGIPGWDVGSGSGQNVVDSMGGHMGMAPGGRVTLRQG